MFLLILPPPTAARLNSLPFVPKSWNMAAMKAAFAKFSAFLSRLVIALLAAVALALLLFGHKPTAYHLPNGQRVHGRIVVTFWENWTRFEEAAMRDIVNKYNMSQRRIFVHMVSVSQADLKTVISVAGGDPPDIVVLWSGDMGAFIGHHALTSLQPMVRAGIVTPHTYVPYVWKVCDPFGKLYALGATPETCALYWNKTMFAQAGLNPNQPPNTLRQLDAYARKLNIIGKHGRLIRAGFLPTEPGWWNSFWGVYFGNHLYNYKTGYFNINTPQQIAAYRWFQSFSREYGYRAVDNFQSGFGQFNSPLNAFMCGKVAMELQGPYFANFIRRNKKSLVGHFGVAPFPCAHLPPGTDTYGDVDVWAIPRHARHVQAAMKVLAFFIQPANIEELNHLHCKPSPLMKVSRSFLRHNPNPYIRVFENAMRKQHVAITPPSPIWMRVNSQLNVMAQRIWLGAPVKKSLVYTQHLVNRWVRTSQRIAALRAREHP